MTETPTGADQDPEEYEPDEGIAAVSESTGTVYENDDEVSATPHDAEITDELTDEITGEEP